MLTHFDSEQQKKDCIEALQRSITLWEEVAEYRVPKEDALEKLQQQGTLPWKPQPENNCYLCEYVKQQTKKYLEKHPDQKNDMNDNFASGFDCASYCPVIWSKDNPGNLEKELDPDTPCEQPGSIYHDYELAVNRRPRTPFVPVARQMVSLLQKTLDHVGNLPVQEDPMENETPEKQPRLTKRSSSGQIMVHLEDRQMPFVAGPDHPLYPALCRLVEYEDREEAEA